MASADVSPRREGLPGRLLAAAVEIAAAAQAAGWAGPDAYDGLWFNWPKPLVGGRRRRQAVVQLHARAPVDIRRLYRRTHPVIPKTLGIFGSVGVRAHVLTGDDAALRGGLRALEALAADRRAGDRAWGYPFDVQTRWSFYPAGSPNVVVTTFGGSALLESGVEHLVARGRQAAEWVADELWNDQGFFGYHPTADVNIHNANLLGASLVHAGAGGDTAAADRVATAVRRTLAAQAPDGSFPYGEGAGLEWADSFHTGFVLTCLDRLEDVDPGVTEALRRGAQHFEQFFDAQGRAKMWVDKDFPEDAHSAGTGLTTLSMLVRRGLVEPSALERVAERVLNAGLHNGRAVHRRYRWGRTTVRYLRWCDAHVALGLVDAARALTRDAVAGAPR